MTLVQLQSLMAGKGCARILAKELSANDNSKNQVYLGGDFKAVNCFPNLDITTDDTGTHGFVYKAAMRFSWVDDSGDLFNAPGTKLILYPQYPEVRMSGFLLGCRNAPSALMTGRIPGRILFLGIQNDGNVLGHVVAPDDGLAVEFKEQKHHLAITGVFHVIPSTGAITGDNRVLMLQTFRRIHLLGWIESKRLSGDGSILPYRAPNGGGYTLEAELGITPNGYSEPDFMGWEVKQHSVTRLESCDSGVLTLMTPEPTGGIYKDSGAEVFVRSYGYPDRNGRVDRLNFGGIHQCGNVHPLTHLEMRLRGYCADTRKITANDGAVVLVDVNGNEAATWSFVGLMKHWNRKHNQAVYIPSITRILNEIRQYRYGNLVRLGEGVDFLDFLSAMANGVIYYDPGIKIEAASTGSPRIKKRSQFRIHSGKLKQLYRRFEKVDVLTV